MLKEGAEKTNPQVVPSASVNRCPYYNKACNRFAVSDALSETEMCTWCKNLSFSSFNQWQTGIIYKLGINTSVPSAPLSSNTFTWKTYLKIQYLKWKQVFQVLGATGTEEVFFSTTDVLVKPQQQGKKKQNYNKKATTQVKLPVPVIEISAFHLFKFYFGEMDKWIRNS